MQRLLFAAVTFALVMSAAPSRAQTGEPPQPQFDRALEDLSQQVGQPVDRTEIDAIQWSAQTFSNSSLGCPKPDANYAQVLTPGYQILISYGGKTYDYRAPQQGNSARLCSVSDSAAASAATPTEPSDTGKQYGYENFSFRVDPALGVGDVLAGTVPAVDPSADLPYFALTPEYIQFAFASFMNDTQPSTPPQIDVYPVADYEALAGDPVTTEVNSLRAVLDPSAPVDTQTSLPYLPLQGAAQVFVARPQMIEFSGGSGIRYVTAFSQALMPISNDSLLYTFQGLTEDGQTYISATFPVRASILPETAASTDATGADNASVVSALNALDPAGFTPTLEQLDALIRSLTVDTSTSATSVSWEAAQTLILNGSVKQATQLHSGEVRLTLQDGRQVNTIEPNLDDLMTVVQQCGDPCANLVIATE